ncbi:MAG: gfo/Idh/MocA family oxidoreductase, partial [Planctomycetaceae bacterium]
WALRDQAPVRCWGTGGRQARSGAESGNVYDHFSVVYEFGNGVKAFCSCRQIDGCDDDVTDHIVGTKGVAHTQNAFNVTQGRQTVWSYPTKQRDLSSMFQNEHKALFASIREGTAINNGDYMTKSTLLAIMGRMSAYTGKTITWDQALASQEDFRPASYEWGSLPAPAVAIPGVTRFV